MSSFTRILGTVLTVAVWLAGSPVSGQKLTALARYFPASSAVEDGGEGTTVRIGLSQGVPFRLFTLDDPRRLVIDFHEVDWTGFDPERFDRSDVVSAARTGVVRPGWSRMVLDLARPIGVVTAGIERESSETRVVIRLAETTPEDYAAQAGAPVGSLVPERALPRPAPSQTPGGKPVVVLDPGHGGIDPGAEREGAVESELMLTFARELQEALLRTGKFDVVLTRQGDEFVPLEGRLSIARRAGADVFISLHADALIEGRASGSTVYTLSRQASDIASQKLAERHDRADLLAGVDLAGQDDVIATVLMDMARNETAPRTENLARELVEGLRATVGVHKRPHLRAGFSVLKAPDIPSVLVEIGFLSSPRDRERLLDLAWRARAVQGIRDALLSWAEKDAADAQLLRK